MPEIAVIIPCYNEEQTVSKVVSDFQRELPQAKIYVFDNNSSDKTAVLASEAGAIVIPSKRPGKGAVIRHAFHCLNADIFLIVDGDDTYPAESAKALIAAVENGADMVVGDRISLGHYSKENKRAFHNFGNALVCRSINLLFQTNIQDVMSGYRAFSKNFIKNCPILVHGFEVEVEMTLHAVDKLFHIEEIPIQYRDRPPGSVSKLNTVTDGINVLRSIFWVFKDSKPLWFFSFLASVQFLFAAVAASFNLTPLAIGALITAVTTLCAGFILDTLAKYHREEFEVQLLKNP